MQYKCVPAPQTLFIDKRGSKEEAVRSFANIINREASDGWNFHSMENIAVIQTLGCLAALFGSKETTVYFNMLVFSKEGNVSSAKHESKDEKPVAKSSNVQRFEIDEKEQLGPKVYYEATANTSILSAPSNDASRETSIWVYDKVILLNTSSDYPDWLYVKNSSDGKKGWVKSTSLKKC